MYHDPERDYPTDATRQRRRQHDLERAHPTRRDWGLHIVGPEDDYVNNITETTRGRKWIQRKKQKGEVL